MEIFLLQHLQMLVNNCHHSHLHVGKMMVLFYLIVYLSDNYQRRQITPLKVYIYFHADTVFSVFIGGRVCAVMYLFGVLLIRVYHFYRFNLHNITALPPKPMH